MMNAAVLNDSARAVVISTFDAIAIDEHDSAAKMPSGLNSAIARPARSMENGDRRITPTTSEDRGAPAGALVGQVWSPGRRSAAAAWRSAR